MIQLMCTLFLPFLDCLRLIGNTMQEGGCVFRHVDIILLCISLYSLIIGLTSFTNKSHICRATLEAVCFQSREASSVSGTCTHTYCAMLCVWSGSTHEMNNYKYM